MKDSTATPSPPQLSRLERKRQRRVGEILRATAVCLRSRGYNNMSLEDIADQLDLAKASLYHYFDSKESLVYECLLDCHSTAQARLEAIATGPGHAPDRLRALIREQLNILVIDDPDRSPFFLYPLDLPEFVQDALVQWRSEHDKLFRGVIAEGVAQGRWERDRAAMARMCLHAALSHVPEWLKVDSRPLTLEKTMSELVDVLMGLFEPRS